MANVAKDVIRPYENGTLAARLPLNGEVIVAAIPFTLGPDSILEITTLSSARLNCRRVHPAVVVDVEAHEDHWGIDLYLCRSFSSEPDGIAFVDGLTDAEKDRLLPVPYSGSKQLATPKGFGAPLDI